ncbi:MAG: acetolactate synthase [Verrucomicrobia bacterium]|nr:acetolactate synthase [Verrucomicrobiota bacterium]
MTTATPPKTSAARRPDAVTQFSVFTANRLGRLFDLTHMLNAHTVSILALTVVDSTDCAIIRCVVDDPDRARELMAASGFPFTESAVVVVEVDSPAELNAVMAALLEAEVNCNYLYSFIPHPRGKSIMAFSMEDNEVAETVLKRHQFQVLKQGDLSR